jgi:hypothetical protein
MTDLSRRAAEAEATRIAGFAQGVVGLAAPTRENIVADVARAAYDRAMLAG